MKEIIGLVMVGVDILQTFSRRVRCVFFVRVVANKFNNSTCR